MGRVDKKWQVILITLGAMVLMAATIPLAIWVTHTQTAQLANARDRCQIKQHSAYQVVIQNNQVVPEHTTARLCGTLTITNKDNRLRLVAFGPHDHHISYDGISEKLLNQNQSLTITLIKAGSFTFHDHTDDSLRGAFTVRP